MKTKLVTATATGAALEGLGQKFLKVRSIVSFRENVVQAAVGPR